MKNTKKFSLVETLGEKLSSFSHFLLIGFKGTSHKTLEKLRKELQSTSGSVTVVKNTLFEKAIQKNAIKTPHLKEVAKQFPLKENSAVVFFNESWEAGLKAIAAFIKKEESVLFKFGLLDKVLYNQANLKTLATLPGRTEFMGKFAYLFKSPISRTVFATKYPITMLVNVLKQKAQKG